VSEGKVGRGSKKRRGNGKLGGWLAENRSHRSGMVTSRATQLSSGSRLGTYEVLAPLGAGGMGEVYRARDTRLGREVAIKVRRIPVTRPAIRGAQLSEGKVGCALEERRIKTSCAPTVCRLGFEEWWLV
jgi:serine/threonine protein kinase